MHLISPGSVPKACLTSVHEGEDVVEDDEETEDEFDESIETHPFTTTPQLLDSELRLTAFIGAVSIVLLTARVQHCSTRCRTLFLALASMAAINSRLYSNFIMQ